MQNRPFRKKIMFPASSFGILGHDLKQSQAKDAVALKVDVELAPISLSNLG